MKLPLGKLHIWEVATWENTIGKLQIRKMSLGKYLTSISQIVGFNLRIICLIPQLNLSLQGMTNSWDIEEELNYPVGLYKIPQFTQHFLTFGLIWRQY